MESLNIKLCTFNCCSLRKNVDLVRGLAGSGFDIIFLQETFVTEDKLGLIDYIDENYDCFGVPATFSEKSLVACAGRPEGGMAVLCKKDSSFTINKVVLESNFILINILIGNLSIILVNVYLNSDVWEVATLNRYLHTLSVFDDIISDMNFDSIYFIGDFNADPHSGRAWHNLSNFVSRNSLKCFDVLSLHADTFTFIGYGNSQSRWLDHIIGKEHSDIKVTGIRIMNDVNGSDHLPLQCTLSIKSVNLQNSRFNAITMNESKKYVNWNKIKDGDFDKINCNVNSLLRKMKTKSTFCCDTTGCRKRKHIRWIDSLYYTLMMVIAIATQEFSKECIKKDKFRVIPGWTRRVKELHKTARESFLSWVRKGRQLNTTEHENMLSSRKVFKRALNEAKINEHNEICQSIAEKFSNKNFREFWKDVRKQRGCVKSTNVIDGENQSEKIVDIFANKFLLGQQAVDNDQERNFIHKFKRKWVNGKKMHIRISLVTLKKLISTLNSGVGHDGLHSLFLKKASDEFLNCIVVFLNACFTHCYLPRDLLNGVINPVIKDKKGNITESTNYRPVMQSSCILKIFETHVLNILSEKIFFNSRQFGFCSGLSTSDPCLLLKEVIHEYTKGKNSCYVTFIDLSKAFDRVDHFILGQKLLDQGLPIDIIYILMCYLRNQCAKVTWRGASSNFYEIQDGVRQGGILSPFLFKFYIDDLMGNISDMNEGCTFGISKLNILAYADDIVLIAQSINDMDKLYSKLCDMIQNSKLIMNKTKSKLLIFHKSASKVTPSVLKLLDDEFEVVKNYKYLGHIIESTLQDSKDIALRLNKFYSSTNSLFRNFKNVNADTLLFLFNSYCMPTYGLCLWSYEMFRKCIFKTFEVAHSNFLKRLINVPTYASNHVSADICGQLLLKHHVALLKVQYFKRLMHSQSILVRMNLPFLMNGHFIQDLICNFKDIYDVDVTQFDIDTLKSRIIWVQKHEARRGVCPYYLI